jgi:dihydropteroate synthase
MSRAAGIPAAHPAATWQCGATRFDLTARALVMGVLNVTPDSFSDGGRFLDPEAALAHARALLAEGADLIDVGAESTRPGSEPVAPEDQWQRLAPVITPLAGQPGACVSVDTANAWVAERALAAGARVINDVSGLRDPAMAGVVARAGAGLVLMHMRGEPRTMQADPRYDDVRADVTEFLLDRARAAEAAGVPRAAIALDPGIGFGKTLAHNLALLAGVSALAAYGYPVVIGASRKSFLGRLLDRTVEERRDGGLAVAAIAVFEGARIVRTHDVAATLDAVTTAEALRRAR